MVSPVRWCVLHTRGGQVCVTTETVYAAPLSAREIFAREFCVDHAAHCLRAQKTACTCEV